MAVAADRGLRHPAVPAGRPALAWGLSRRRVPGRAIWEGLVLLPLVLPPTVLGYYLLTTLGAQSRVARGYHRLTGRDLHVVFTWQGATLAACIVSLPLLVRAAQASFAALDKDLLDAARVFGASETQVFRLIALPLARRGVWAGLGLAFARALGDFGATLMVGGSIPGQTRTLPIVVYDAYNAGDERLGGPAGRPAFRRLPPVCPARLGSRTARVKAVSWMPALIPIPPRSSRRRGER